MVPEAMALGDITIEKTKHARTRPAEAELGFGKHFTDHMLTIPWDIGRGWHSPAIVPYGPLSLDPAASSLHYGQEMFEGMKAFRGADGKVRLWRLMRHCPYLVRGLRRAGFRNGWL